MNLITKLTLACFSLILMAGCNQKEEAKKRPNILFIMSDDHAYQALIPEKRKAMDDAYDKYTDLSGQRDMLLYATVGVYVLNIIDAVVFAHHYKPILPKDVGDKLHFNIGTDPTFSSASVFLSYKF